MKLTSFAMILALAGSMIVTPLTAHTDDVEQEGDHRSNVGRPRKSSGATRKLDPIGSALAWLADHQAEDGSWDADAFGRECDTDPALACGGAGQPTHDVGVTGLAVLCFLECGHTSKKGEYQRTLQNAVEWLQSRQDQETGELGDRVSHTHAYNHAIGTLALAEMYGATKDPAQRPTVERAVAFVLRSRNPYSAWRYDSPPIGDNDTSVTGWMTLALASAEHAGIAVDEHAFQSVRSWVEEVTDPNTGRVGYDSRGGMSSRVPGINDDVPVESGEAMTAVGLMLRGVIGPGKADEAIMQKHVDLLLKKLPEWDPEGLKCDMYYWYFGSIAMRFADRHSRKAWKAAMRTTLQEAQRTDGHQGGSWDPVGPWGHFGGRVYSTSLLCMSLKMCSN